MANRQMLTSATAGVVTGDDYMDNVAGHLTRLYDAAAFPLTGIGGTGNAVTANLDPVLTVGLVTGMKFTLTWAVANSAGVTLAINGGAAVPVLGATGSALTTGALVAGGRSIIEYVGSAFVVLSGAGSSAGAAVLPQFTLLTVSGTWTKPTGYPDDHRVMIEAVGGGGGGGGGNGGGGGGGACLRRWLPMAQIPASVNYLIGSGGSVGAGGGNSTFGALVTGFGGAAGISGGGGGNGAGLYETGAAGGYLGGGLGGGSGLDGGAATVDGGGGGGGHGSSARSGGRAIYGGGGGGGKSGGYLGAGGSSMFGGAGGAGGVAGQAPGGGGGGNAAGARGEIRIWL